MQNASFQVMAGPGIVLLIRLPLCHPFLPYATTSPMISPNHPERMSLSAIDPAIQTPHLLIREN